MRTAHHEQFKSVRGGFTAWTPLGVQGGLRVAVCEGNMVTTQRNVRDLSASPRYYMTEDPSFGRGPLSCDCEVARNVEDQA